MNPIQRIGDWTLNHPDTILVATGFAVGLGLATVGSAGVIGMVASGLFCGLFTLLIAHIEPHEPPLGPQQ